MGMKDGNNVLSGFLPSRERVSDEMISAKPV
jgi:hypothetical protein